MKIVIAEPLRAAGDEIGNAEHEQIAALRVRHLARQHSRDFAHGQASQQALADGCGKAL